MSIVGSYVKCHDGKVYKDLVYRDRAGQWFICFDDDDPVELVVRQNRPVDPVELLKELGFSNPKTRRALSGKRIFYIPDCPGSDLIFSPAVSWWVFQDPGPFPTPRAWDTHGGALEPGETVPQGVFHGGTP